MQDDLQQIFADGGILARQIKGYHPRQAQQEMAQRIADTLASATVLVAEAGTGTGKTFAYLAPAILSGQKVFISTGTKNLQDQLFRRDLPTLRKALAVPFQAAILKGRGNYLCHHRLTLAEQDPLLLSQSDALRSLRDWSQSSKNGDLSESDLLENQSNLWPRVTSTVDNCLGQQCPEYQQCFIVEARRRAQEADIVVINHHLLMSDFALKSAGQGEVLPTADAFIIDEAHQLPAIAGQFLGNRISSNQIVELCRDTVQEVQEHAADSKTLGLHAEKLQAKLQSLRLHIGNVEQRTPWLTQLFNDEIKNNFNELVDYLEVFESELAPLAVQSPGLSQCHVRAKELVNIIQLFSEQNDDNLVLWLDNRPTGFVLHATPFEISQHFQQWLEEKPAAWVFTSATLTVAGKFNHFCQHLGIENAEYASWESPFDYAKQSLLYLPNIPVEPSDRQYNQYVADIAKEVILHSQGRIFLLFTSYRAMHEVADLLADLDYPLMVQGSGAKATLLEEFRQHGNAVLLGTNSFWEGVDVRGEALSCVLIDKIPFASPGDPVLEARINNLRERGGNPFRSIQIPSAVIQLKQGIGRLIRDEQDHGVLILCDPRLLNKPYGKVFMRSLPAMPITQDINQVEDFFVQRQVKTAI
ncbi:ATP-dependent DNA helicase [Methylophaga nitratireducenticrescens]|uniref:ATP-dependent DNA helicase n=1 Tax=Methylophaga nitratireducenticrescens TaxID=754476 RepID=UPI000CDCC07A|nr:ATP-dependent DNA helicase [Methylophaga nitratireducenticrescens]AUZ84807.1 helicase [Methylophaga nitratireducenticrescens]